MISNHSKSVDDSKFVNVWILNQMLNQWVDSISGLNGYKLLVYKLLMTPHEIPNGLLKIAERMLQHNGYSGYGIKCSEMAFQESEKLKSMFTDKVSRAVTTM